MKGPTESGQICSGGRRKIAKKIAKNKRCYANCRSDIAAAIVIAIARNAEVTAARLVGCPVELGHREVDPGADRCHPGPDGALVSSPRTWSFQPLDREV